MRGEIKHEVCSTYILKSNVNIGSESNSYELYWKLNSHHKKFKVGIRGETKSKFQVL